MVLLTCSSLLTSTGGRRWRISILIFIGSAILAFGRLILWEGGAVIMKGLGEFVTDTGNAGVCVAAVTDMGGARVF